jgi:hypothetical protein
VGQNHTKAGQNSISASSSNKLVNSAVIFFNPWRIKKGGRDCPHKGPLKELVVPTRYFLTQRRLHLEATAAASCLVTVM